MKRLYSYALLKALIDEGHEFFDAFWPLIIKSLPKDDYLAVDLVQEKLDSAFKIKLPLSVLKTILDRAKDKGYLKIRIINGIDEYSLTQKGIEYEQSKITTRQVKEDLELLRTNIREYYKAKGIDLNEKEIETILEKFIIDNLDALVGFFKKSDEMNNLSIEDVVSTRYYILIDYINEINLKSQREYNTLKNLVLGSVICAVISSEKSFRLLNLGNTDIKLKEFNVYLDTNFVFGLLDLDFIYFNKSCQELFELFKKFELKIYVFSFTVDEIRSVINGYQKYIGHPLGVIPKNIYYSLRKKGWKQTNIYEFISSLKQNLNNKGISIQKVENINLDKYHPSDPKIKQYFNENSRIKLRTTSAQNHDIAAIETIKSMRGGNVDAIEEAKYIFITTDKNLNRVNFIGMGHKENNTIPEVILDTVFTSILWIKDPKINVSLESVIASYSKESFMQADFWDTFHNILRESMKATDPISLDRNITTLSTHTAIKKYLLEENLETSSEVVTHYSNPETLNKMTIEEIKSLDTELREKEEQEKYCIAQITTLNEKVSKQKEVETKLKDNNENLKKQIEELKNQLTTKDNEISRLTENNYTSQANTFVFVAKIVVLFLAFYFWDKLIEISKYIPIFMLAIAIFGVKLDEIWNKLHNIIKRITKFKI